MCYERQQEADDRMDLYLCPFPLVLSSASLFRCMLQVAQKCPGICCKAFQSRAGMMWLWD